MVGAADCFLKPDAASNRHPRAYLRASAEQEPPGGLARRIRDLVCGLPGAGTGKHLAKGFVSRVQGCNTSDVTQELGCEHIRWVWAVASTIFTDPAVRSQRWCAELDRVHAQRTL